MYVFIEVVVAGHLMDLAALLVQPHSGAPALNIDFCIRPIPASETPVHLRKLRAKK